MKRKIFAVVMLLVFCVIGCAGKRHAMLKIENDGTITHNDRNASFLLQPINPQDLANSEATIVTARAQADLTRALAKQIEHGQAATITGHYIGIIINDDPSLTAYIPHPEMNQRLKIAPSSFAVISSNNIADKITIYDSNGNYTVTSTFKEGGVYNGIKYDYGVRIYKVR